MSKPDASGAKSLEEILASIRKSLAGEGSDASGGSRGAAPRPVQAAPELEPLAEAPGDGDGLLSARLAGALSGPGNAAPLDDDFADLLAPDDRKPAPTEAAGTAKPTDARNEGKDPLWFLRQPPGPAQSNGQQAPAARTQPGEGSPPPTQTPPTTAAPAEEVKLSRPEVLRASLPPLFGAENEHPPAATPVARMTPPGPAKAPAVSAPAAQAQAATVAVAASAAAKTAPATPLTARTQPAMPPVQPAGATVAEAVTAAEPEAPSAPTEPEPTAVRETAREETVEAEPAPQPPAAAKPAIGLLAEANADTAAKVAPTQLHEPPAAKPAPVASAPQARALEQVIAELLEPVIRQWLDANLPRLVEEAVRKEVARAIDAERSTPKA